MAAELLKRANELIKNKIHPTTVMTGYRLALKEAVKYIKANLCVPVDKLGRRAAVFFSWLYRGNAVFRCFVFLLISNFKTFYSWSSLKLPQAQL